jgi:hypothetical protein
LHNLPTHPHAVKRPGTIASPYNAFRWCKGFAVSPRPDEPKYSCLSIVSSLKLAQPLQDALKLIRLNTERLRFTVALLSKAPERLHFRAHELLEMIGLGGETSCATPPELAPALHISNRTGGL